ncbi:MAG: UbiH/UbiF family hydroxylase [Gemmobacter sp.]
MRENVDILVSGGGVAGLAAAAAFGAAGFRVICVEPAPPVTDADAEGADLRTTAILQPGVAVLQTAGVWPRLAPQAAALQVMRIVDAGGEGAEPRRIRDFDAAEISDAPFGWNLPNWLLRRELVARLAELDTVSFRPGVGTLRVLTRDAEALVTLSDGASLSARLVVAADGRASPLRQALGIGVRTWRYGQKALSFAVSHPVPHGQVSTEIHRAGGPFTLVPLPDREGLPCSAVVWMERGAEAQHLAALPVASFEAEATARSAHVLGPLTLLTKPQVWPIIAQVADRMAGERVALIAEAAHVLPPIGAQGLNMSLADIATLQDLADRDRAGLGGTAMLDTYHRRRHPDVLLRVTGIDLLNRAAMAGSAPWHNLRGLALDALYGAVPVRRGLMRAGLGVR